MCIKSLETVAQKQDLTDLSNFLGLPTLASSVRIFENSAKLMGSWSYSCGALTIATDSRRDAMTSFGIEQ